MTTPDQSSALAPLSAIGGRELATIVVFGAIALAAVVAMARYRLLPDLAFGYIGWITNN